MSANTTDQDRNTKNHKARGGNEGNKEKNPHSKPEAMVLGIGAWMLALGLEALQQVLNVAASFFDMGSLRAQTVKLAQERGQDLSDSMITGLTVTTLIFSGLLGLIILGIIFYFVRKVATRGKNAESLQKLLSFFGGYLLFKAILITFTPPTGNLPVAYYAISGALQIIVGVAAVVGAILINRKESVEWVAGDKKKDDRDDRNRPLGPNSGNKDNDERPSLFGSLFGKDKDHKDNKTNKDESAERKRTVDELMKK